MGKLKRKTPTWMHAPLTAAVRTLMGLPLVAGTWPSGQAATWLGRTWAAAPLNRTRLARAESHLRQAFPTWTHAQVTACAHASYQHLFRLAIEFLAAPRLITDDNWPRHFEIPHDLAPNAALLAALRDPAGPTGQGPIGAGPALDILLSGRRCILVTGHCGNWEVLGYALATVGFSMHALYRPLDNTALDRWVRTTRQRRGLELIDKFGASRHIGAVMEHGEPLAFVADQNAGDRGLFVPYFGRLASTYKAIGLLAIQHDAPVICSVARSVPRPETWRDTHGFRYRIDVADVIEPEAWKSQPDPLFYLTARYRRALERMVSWAPEQYLWMHRIWKSRPRHETLGRPMPKALVEKLRSLPWMTDAELARLTQDRAPPPAPEPRPTDLTDR